MGVIKMCNWNWLKKAQTRLNRKHSKILLREKNSRYNGYLDLVRDYILIDVQKLLVSKILQLEFNNAINIG